MQMSILTINELRMLAKGRNRDDYQSMSREQLEDHALPPVPKSVLDLELEAHLDLNLDLQSFS